MAPNANSKKKKKPPIRQYDHRAQKPKKPLMRSAGVPAPPAQERKDSRSK